MPPRKKNRFKGKKRTKSSTSSASASNQVEQDGNVSVTQSTAASDAATTQGTVNSQLTAPPTPTRRHRKLPSPGPLRRSKRIRSRSSSVGDETAVAVPTTSKIQRMETDVADAVPAQAPESVAGPSTTTDVAVGGLETDDDEGVEAVPPSKLNKNIKKLIKFTNLTFS